MFCRNFVGPDQTFNFYIRSTGLGCPADLYLVGMIFSNYYLRPNFEIRPILSALGTYLLYLGNSQMLVDGRQDN